jgi:hypothetical protein
MKEYPIVTAYDFISVTEGSEQSDGVHPKVLFAGRQQ